MPAPFSGTHRDITLLARNPIVVVRVSSGGNRYFLKKREGELHIGIEYSDGQ
jgi:hypothetical protein